MAAQDDDSTVYKVVINDEEQYSIWSHHRDNPLGWHDAGKSGTKQECLDYIEAEWTDMRPLSLRKQMRDAGISSQPAGSPPGPDPVGSSDQ